MSSDKYIIRPTTKHTHTGTRSRVSGRTVPVLIFVLSVLTVFISMLPGSTWANDPGRSAALTKTEAYRLMEREVSAESNAFTASFVDTTKVVTLYAQSVAIDGVGGRIKSAEAGCTYQTLSCPQKYKSRMNCPAGTSTSSKDVCVLYFRAGSVVNLTAVPDNSSTVFAGWIYLGDIATKNYFFGLGTAKITLVNVNGTAAVQGYFASKSRTYTLNVGIGGEGSITGTRITSEPSGIDCQGDGTGVCAYDFPAGSYVKLTAIPGSYAKFYGWSNTNNLFSFMNGCSGTGVCTVPMSYFFFGGGE